MDDPRYPTPEESAALAASFAADMAKAEAERAAALPSRPPRQPARIYPPVTPDEVERAATHMDIGWQGNGWKPSEIMALGFVILSTMDASMAPNLRGTVSRQEAGWEAAQFQSAMVAEARDRWRRGFYADPFTKTPRLRIAEQDE